MVNSLYFDVISLDATSLLVRYLAEQPLTNHWLTTVNANDALAVLSCQGTLSAAAREQFTTLDEFDFKNRHHLLLDSLTSILAPHLERLYLPPSLSRTLNCNQLGALRVLQLDGSACRNTVESILAVCGCYLLELHLGNMLSERRMIQTIALHCRSLQVLDLGYYEYQGTLEIVWRAVGNTLRELRGLVLEEEFVHVARHCIRLEKLDLSYWKDIWFSSTTAELLKALTTLRVLNLNLFEYDFEPTPSKVNDIHTLLSVCHSELRIHSEMYFRHIDNSVDFIRAIGPRLRVLSLRYEFCSFVRDMFQYRASLTELSLHPNTVDVDKEYVTAMQSIFIEPMPNLRKLFITFLDGPKMLPVLARSISSLIEFECHLAAQFDADDEQISPVKGKDFDDFLKANKRIQRFSVVYRCMNGGTINCGEEMTHETAELIKRFRFSRFLNEVEIDIEGMAFSQYSIEIRNACVPMRTRHVNVMINGQRLLP